MNPKTPYQKIFIISFILNLVWEYLHTPLYSSASPAPANVNSVFFIIIILIAAIADAFAITAIFWLNTLINKTKNWLKNPKPRDYAFITLAGLIAAILVEYYALTNNIWGYNQYMPLIFGIGLTPLVQLATTAIITLLVIRRNNSSA